MPGVPDPPFSDYLIAQSHVLVATKVRLEALADRVDHVGAKAARTVVDLDALQDRVAQLEFSRRSRGVAWKWGLAVVAGIAALLGVVQAFVALSK